MEAWEKWWRMAQGSLVAAQSLEKQGEARSSASRAYYAAYQSATAILLYLKQTPPQDREAWSHEATPHLVRKLPAVFWTQDKRNDLSARLSRLYVLRVAADYVSGTDIDPVSLSSMLKDAGYIVATVGTVLNQGTST